MGPPPRSLTAEANSCFMVRVPHGPNRIQGCGASIAPERGLPSDQLYRTSNNEGNRVAVTLDTNVLIQGCVKTRGSSIAIEQVSRSRPFQVPALQAHSISRSNSRMSFSPRPGILSFRTAWVKTRKPQCEQMFSALPLRADIAQCSRYVGFVPTRDSCTAAMTKRCPHSGRSAAYKARVVI